MTTTCWFSLLHFEGHLKFEGLNFAFTLILSHRILYHNLICDKIIHLSFTLFSFALVRTDPKILKCKRKMVSRCGLDNPSTRIFYLFFCSSLVNMGQILLLFMDFYRKSICISEEGMWLLMILMETRNISFS